MNSKKTFLCALMMSLLVACSGGESSDEEMDVQQDMSLPDMARDMGRDQGSEALDMSDLGDVQDADVSLDMEADLAPDMPSCDDGMYVTEAGTCGTCPALDWSCKQLEETITFEAASSVVTVTLPDAGYRKAILYGSVSTTQGGGMMASPFQLEAAHVSGAFAFDLSPYKSGAEVNILSLEVFTACEDAKKTRLYIRWLTENDTLDDALCL